MLIRGDVGADYPTAAWSDVCYQGARTVKSDQEGEYVAVGDLQVSGASVDEHGNILAASDAGREPVTVEANWI